MVLEQLSPLEIGGSAAIAIILVTYILRWVKEMRQSDMDMLDSSMERSQIGERRAVVLTEEDIHRIEAVVWKGGCGSKVQQKVNDLHKWHDVVDDDGVRLWYVKRSFEESVHELTTVFRNFVVMQQQQIKLLEKLVEKVDKIA